MLSCLRVCDGFWFFVVRPTPQEASLPLPEYKLTFLWQEKNIAVGVDQVYSRGQVSPLTEFFFWPRKVRRALLAARGLPHDALPEARAQSMAETWLMWPDRHVLNASYGLQQRKPWPHPSRPFLHPKHMCCCRSW